MVLKGTKRSLRTGNTVRNTRDRQTNSVIVRHVSNTTGRRQTDEADDSYLTADAVEFSLNKKGRWNLPEVIERNITSAAVGDSAVALLRRHRVNRQNDCVSVVACGASAGDQVPSEAAVFQRKKARRKTYCNGLNVLHNGRGKSNKEIRKKKVVSTKKDLAEQKQRQTLDTVPENAEVSATPEVRYDVLYPLPATSSLRFHPKFHQSRTPNQDSADIEDALTLTTNVKPGKGSHQRYKHVDYDDFYEEDDYYDDWIYSEEDYPEESLIYGDEYDHDGHEADGFGHSLYSDVMEQAFQLALWRSATTAGRGKRKPRCRKARGGRFFYSPETENEFDSCLEDGQSQTSTESDQSAFSVSSESSVIKFAQIPSVVVELSREATSPRRLSEQYGVKYTEAACSPRKIVLEITDRVQAALTNLSVFRDVFMPSLDLTTYLIFTYICPSDQTQKPVDCCSCNKEMDESSPAQCSANEEKYDMFRAQLNMNCMSEGLTFSLPEDTQFNDVEDILEQILKVMTTLTPESLVRQPGEASASILKSRLKPDFSTLAEVNGWKASFVSLLDEQAATTLPVGFPHSPLQSRSVTDQDDSCSSDNIASPENQVSDTNKDQGLVVKTCSEMYCHVCFTEISPGSPQGPSATALAGCGHWFCDGCWQFHLAVATQEQGSRTLQCPEFRCDAEVDLSTLLSLQPVRDVLVHQRRQVEVQVMRMFLCKWCPNPCCGRVVKLATSSPSKVVVEPTSMTCPCGQRFCFRCHGDPHWPLSCEHFTEYQAALRQRGHRLTLDYAPVVVRGKACPSCRRFIEKYGGCPAMMCLCGFQFWWCCKKPISSSHTCTNIIQVNDLTNTYKKVIHDERKPSSRDEPEWLEMAVTYRSAQGTGQVRRDYRRVEQLRDSLLSLSAKGVDVGVLAPENRSPAAGTAQGSALLKPDRSAAKRVRSLAGENQSRPDKMVVAKERGKNRRRAGLMMESPTTPTVSEHTRQCIRRTTCGMLKLKMELNSVLENTAAWLHLIDTGRGGGSDSPRSGTISKVKDIVQVLQFMVASLDGLLGAQGRELTRVLPWFRSLQRNTKDTLTTLAGLLHR